jgi:integral membrane sensor domain MASE1
MKFSKKLCDYGKEMTSSKIKKIRMVMTRLQMLMIFMCFYMMRKINKNNNSSRKKAK